MTCPGIGRRSGQRPTRERSRESLFNRVPSEIVVVFVVVVVVVFVVVVVVFVVVVFVVVFVFVLVVVVFVVVVVVIAIVVASIETIMRGLLPPDSQHQVLYSPRFSLLLDHFLCVDTVFLIYVFLYVFVSF